MTTNPPYMAGQPELHPSVDLASYEGSLCLFFVFNYRNLILPSIEYLSWPIYEGIVCQKPMKGFYVKLFFDDFVIFR